MPSPSPGSREGRPTEKLRRLLVRWRPDVLAPIRLDDAASLGRVDIELLPDGSAAAAYMEFAEQRAQFRVRRIRPDGSKSDPVTVSGMAGSRGSGYPRMVLSGDELVFAWTDRDTKSQVRRLPPGCRSSSQLSAVSYQLSALATSLRKLKSRNAES